MYIIIILSISLITSFVFVFVFIYSKNKTIKPSFIEKSTKFSENKKFNENREVYGYNTLDYSDPSIKFKEISLKHNIDNEIIDIFNKFLHNKPKDGVQEIIYGNDKNKIKLYINYENNIYCIEKLNSKYSLKIYEPFIFNKKFLDNFVNKKQSDLFCNLFKVNNDNIVYIKYPQDNDFNINSIHINLREPIKIKDNKNKILELLKTFNLNTEGINQWFNKYNNYLIIWIAITKQGNKNDITFYYREKILNN